MTERQLIAITNPCATPEETLARQFYRTVEAGKAMWVVTCLTINK